LSQSKRTDLFMYRHMTTTSRKIVRATRHSLRFHCMYSDEQA